VAGMACGQRSRVKACGTAENHWGLTSLQYTDFSLHLDGEAFKHHDVYYENNPDVRFRCG